MLSFDEAKHEYKLDGVVLPSVTQIIAPLYDFGGINKDVLDYAADRGTAIHRATELHDLNDLDETTLDPVIVPYLEAWKLFIAENSVCILHCEQRLSHDTMKYAGTLDRIAEMKGDEWVLDVKATAALSPVVGVQLAGYAGMTAPGKRRGAVQLKPDGTYRLQEYTNKTDWPTFVSLLTIFNWRKHHEK